MSENVTHVAVCDDVIRIASKHPLIPAEVKEVLETHRELARLGAATRSADKWTAEVVAWGRDNWDAGDGDLVKQKLAFVLGALTHRAADRLFKPIFQYCREQYGEETGRECSIHCDVYVFNEVYAAGTQPSQSGTRQNGSLLPTSQENPYQRDVFKAPLTDAGKSAEALLRVMWQRALIGMHTFSPDSGDMLGWLDRMFAQIQAFKIDLDQYQQAIDRPDPAKSKRYIEDTHSYDRDDQLIAVARRMQRGDDVSSDEVLAALDATSDESSRYARALKRGMQYLLGAAQLWRREIDQAQAKTTFDVGVPERSLVFEPALALAR